MNSDFVTFYFPACFVMWQSSSSSRITVGIGFKVPYPGKMFSVAIMLYTVVGTNSYLPVIRR